MSYCLEHPSVPSSGPARRGRPIRRGDKDALPAFVLVAAAVFASGAVATVSAGTSMSAMTGTPMPGGWILGSIWTPMCGQTWAGLSRDFLNMWSAMTAAMMAPSVAPALWRWRRAVGRTGAPSPGRLTALVALGYAVVWMLIGVLVFALGAALAQAAMSWAVLARVAPLAGALIVVGAGALQFTAWKARRLACCRDAACCPATGAGGALRRGVSLGLDCGACCAGPTAVLMVVGMMDLWAMAAVTLAITLERLAPNGVRFARLSGAAAITFGLVLVARAVI